MSHLQEIVTGPSVGAEGGTRTHTPFRAPTSKDGVSTNSATSALGAL